MTTPDACPLCGEELELVMDSNHTAGTGSPVLADHIRHRCEYAKQFRREIYGHPEGPKHRRTYETERGTEAFHEKMKAAAREREGWERYPAGHEKAGQFKPRDAQPDASEETEEGETA